MENFDILIIGAGASGLIAAGELSLKGFKVGVIEARDRVGGRIHTIYDEKFAQPIETGAEFVHGTLPLTLSLLKKYGINTIPVPGEMWRTEGGQLTPDADYVEGFDDLIKYLKELKTDVTVETFLQTHFAEEKYEPLRTSIRKFVEGFDTADPTRASAFCLRDEWLGFEEEEEEQFRVEGGYTRLIQALETDCLKNGCRFFLSSPVKEIRWAKDYVQVFTADMQHYAAAKVIVTVPLAVLLAPEESEAGIKFVPDIADVKEAAKGLGFGPVIKIIIQFGEAFWTEKKYGKNEDLSTKEMGFFFTDAVVPTWWTQYPVESTILTGWIGGPGAKELKDVGDQSLFESAIHVLSTVFGEKDLAKKVKAWKVLNWIKDPFSQGGYSYITVETNEAVRKIQQPIENTLYFAGEAIYSGSSGGTVEAALTSGYDVVKLIDSDLNIGPSH